MSKKRLFSSFSKILLYFTLLILSSLLVNAYQEFGGFYYEYPPGFTPNPLTGDRCPNGFDSYKFYEYGDDYDVFCHRHTSAEGDFIDFGGMYTSPPGYINPLTGDYTCPDATFTDNNWHSGYHLCYKTVTSPTTFTEFGGMYYDWDPCEPNPLTPPSCDCPRGFTDAAIGTWHFCYRTTDLSDSDRGSGYIDYGDYPPIVDGHVGNLIGRPTGGHCTDDAECIPCAVCDTSIGKCVLVCGNGYKCDLNTGGYDRGKCVSGSPVLPSESDEYTVDHQVGEPITLGIRIYDMGEGLSSILECYGGPGDEDISLIVGECVYGDVDCNCDSAAAWDTGEGWYFTSALSKYPDGTYDSYTSYTSLAYYINYDEDQIFCEAHSTDGWVWLDNSYFPGVDVETYDNCDRDDVPGRYEPLICGPGTSGEDACEFWCGPESGTDDGTCWGDDAGEDGSDGDTLDILCTSDFFDGAWEDSVSSDHKCCGDDPDPGEDCAYIETEWFCYDDSGTWYWKDASDYNNAGLVIEPDCTTSSFVADSNTDTWIECDGYDFVSQPYAISEDPVTGIPPHDYLCNNSKIFECTGSEFCVGKHNIYDCDPSDPSTYCQSGSAGTCMGEGAIITIEGQPEPFFCSDEAEWVPLDDFAYDTSQSVCEGNGYTWLVDKCCGDSNDETDTYIAPDLRACFYGEVIQNGYLSAVDGTVLNLNGKFLTCGYGGTMTGDFEEVTACNVSGLPSPYTDTYYCDIDPISTDNVGWVSLAIDPPDLTPSGTITELSVRDSPLAGTHGCCPLEYCWTGDSCIDDTSSGWGYDEDGIGHTPELYEGDLYQCTAGSWATTATKLDQDHLYSGFCTANQCYHSNGNCYEIGEYVGDDYCEIASSAGKSWDWTTRTKLVALDLLKLVYNGASFTKDFTLACGDYDKMINKPLDIFPKGVAGLYDKFCVLEYDGVRVVGVALEQGTINVQGSTFLETIDFYYDYCNDAMAGGYQPCNVNPKVWYNDDTEILIFSNANINPETSELGFFDVIYGYLYGLIGWVPGIPEPDTWTTQFSWPDGHATIPGIANTRRFDRLYMSRKGSKQVFAVLEKPRGNPTQNLPYSGNPPVYADNTQYYEAIEYTGFNIDICDYVEKYDERLCPPGAHASDYDCFYCQRDGTTYRVFAGYEAYIAPAWFDLTSKLRIE